MMPIPFGMGPWAALYMGLAFFAASFVRGYSGFGFSALVVSAGSLVTNPLNFVAVVMVCEFALTFQQWPSVRRDVDWRRVLTLLSGAAIGLPVELWAITGIGVDLARAIMAIYVLSMCGVMLMGWQFAHLPRQGATFGVGITSGLASAPGMGGLPVASYFAAQTMPAATFRATLVAYFTLLDLYSAPLLWWFGMVSRDTFITAVLAAPLMILGLWLGGRHFLRTGPQEFRRFAIVLLALLAVLGLMKAAF